MKKFKDVDLSKIPAPVAELLKSIIPDSADVEFDFSDPFVGVISAVVGDNDDVKDDCSGMSCKDCGACPIENATKGRGPWLNRKGEHTYTIPDASDYVKDDEDLYVEAATVVRLFHQSGELLATETFGDGPTEDQIKWAILKHKADYATVQQEYSLTC